MPATPARDTNDSAPRRPPPGFPECGNGIAPALAPAEPAVAQKLLFPPLGAFSLG